jgi:hypothetical protein
VIAGWQWVGGSFIVGFPAAYLTAAWVRENGVDEEFIRSTGAYTPVYEEEVTDGTRTKSTSENSIGEGSTGEWDSSNVLHESESGGGDAE